MKKTFQAALLGAAAAAFVLAPGTAEANGYFRPLSFARSVVSFVFRKIPSIPSSVFSKIAGPVDCSDDSSGSSSSSSNNNPVSGLLSWLLCRVFGGYGGTN